MVAARRPFWRTLYFWVLVAIALGIFTGWAWPAFGAEPGAAGHGFVKLVKMIITPVIFLTVVTGIAGMADLKAFGRVGLKALGYFLAVSTLALAIGLVVANRRPARRRPRTPTPAQPTRQAVQDYVNQAHEQSVTAFLLGIIPEDLLQRLHQRPDPAGAVRLHPVRHRSGPAGREGREAAGWPRRR